VGLAIDGTGALLIADDAGNTVWRVASRDGAVTPQPIPTDRLVAAEASTHGEGVANGPAAADPQNNPTVLPPSPTQIAPAISPDDGLLPGD
jgi:hypothetical protein